jgi:hypothetical protein
MITGFEFNKLFIPTVTMQLAGVVKALAFLALLAISASTASSETPRHLRVGQPGSHVALRRLQKYGNLAGWLSIIKTNMRYQPTSDRLYQQLKRIKDSLDDTKPKPK